MNSKIYEIVIYREIEKKKTFSYPFENQLTFNIYNLFAICINIMQYTY